EVRGTAGRLVQAASFSVGSAPECDIQACGDPTVLPVQCVVMSLPSCILVADFWSGGGTQMMWRMSANELGSPIFAEARHPTFVVAHGDRVVLRIGDQTTLTLGPSMKKLEKSRRKVSRKNAEVCLLKKKKNNNNKSSSRTSLPEPEPSPLKKIRKLRSLLLCCS
ncbi:unnamed protein product, partial [Polarella glacialis]